MPSGARFTTCEIVKKANPLMEMYSADRIRNWLMGRSHVLSTFDSNGASHPGEDQDVFHFIAENYNADQLIDFFRLPAITDSRKDDMALSICDRLEWLLDVDDLPENVQDEAQRLDEIQTLSEFIRNNRSSFDGADERIALGWSYENVVLPLIDCNTDGKR